jgi:hypothetical protein
MPAACRYAAGTLSYVRVGGVGFFVVTLFSILTARVVFR